MARVEIPYNPELTIESLYKLIYPLTAHEYDSRTKYLLTGPAIIISESMLTASMIQIKHKKKKNLTYITLGPSFDGSSSATAIQLILSFTIIGIIFILIMLILDKVGKKILPIIEEVADKHLRGNTTNQE